MATDTTDPVAAADAEDLADADAFASAFTESLGVITDDSEPAKVEPKPAVVEPVKKAEPVEPEAKTEPVAKAEPEVEAEVEKKPEPKQEPKPEPLPAPAAKAEPEKPFFSPEDQSVIDEFNKDWPEAARAQELIRRKEYHYVVTHIFDEVAKAVAPIMQYVEAMQTTDHEGAIRSAHEDYDAVSEGAAKWVEDQPKYLRDTYQRVIKEGTAEEVIDLLTRYKDANGIATTASGATKKTEVVVDKPQGGAAGSTAGTASPKAKEAAQRLSVVGTKRSTVGSAAADVNDFEGGFREALGS